MTVAIIRPIINDGTMQTSTRNVLNILFVTLFFATGLTPQVKATELSEAQALSYSKLSLECIHRQYPYKSDAETSSAVDIRTQQEHHPIFYGCFDWHSSVHGHWALLRLLNQFPHLANQTEIEAELAADFKPKLANKEAGFIQRNDQKRFERPYGYAWFFQLMMELRRSPNAKFRQWEKNLLPLEAAIKVRFNEYLDVFNFPIRRGVHENTAFALSHAYDYALSLHDDSMITAIQKKAKQFYSADKNCPIAYEPEGDSFLSPCLAEADLMRRTLSASEFNTWFKSFWPKDLGKFLEPLSPVSKDAKAVHLIGLDFYKSWTMRNLAAALPDKDPLREKFTASSAEHLKTGERLLKESDYGGTHWLASYAIFALTE